MAVKYKVSRPITLQEASLRGEKNANSAWKGEITEAEWDED